MVRDAFGLPCQDLDARGPGWLVTLPQLPLTGGRVAGAAAAWAEAAAVPGMTVSAEVIVVSPELAHGVLQISFARRDRARAHALRDTLIRNLASDGMPPYRADIDHVDLAAHP
jgi:hypothetical protein